MSAHNIAISPLPADHLPPEARSALQHGDMRGSTAQTYAATPPLAHLATAAECAAHKLALRAAADQVFGKAGDTPISQSSIVLVGAPGLTQLYLPQQLAPLQPLLELGATAAVQTGDLGKNFMLLVFKRAPRPEDESTWHRDIGRTHMLCGELSTVFALHGAQLEGNEAWFRKPVLYSPLAGMPVAFNQILHAPPFMVDEDLYFDERASLSPYRAQATCMAVMYSVWPGRDISSYAVHAPEVRAVMQAHTDKPLKAWRPAPLAP